MGKNLLPLVRKDGSVLRVPASQAWRPKESTKNCRLVAQAYHPSVGEAEAEADLAIYRRLSSLTSNANVLRDSASNKQGCLVEEDQGGLLASICIHRHAQV